MINPAALFKAKQALSRFTANHPRFVSFIQVTLQEGIPEGSVIEITVTKPGGEPVTTNMKVQPSDIELFKELKELA